MEPLESQTWWLKQLERAIEEHGASPKYRAIADALELEIRSGALKHNERLLTVREFSRRLGVSGTTVAAAYKLLAQRGLIDSRVGSGTRVSTPPSPAKRLSSPGSTPDKASPWRRRAQTFHINHLQTAFPAARNYASGTPNPDLLPVDILRRAWLAAASNLTASTLRYAGPSPVKALAHVLVPRLREDAVPARASDLVIGSSAQQLMTLSAKVASTLFQRAFLSVAVEEPGYPTIFDTYERLGHRLIGVQVDHEGLMPSALEQALSQGAKATLVTPRAHNPTGVSLSAERLHDLADVLANYPDVVIIEDDQFADATIARPGSFLSDGRLEDRVIYIRSFSKAIAPDLRLAVAVVRPRLRAMLMEEKFYADGWSSTLAQNALANAFADPDLNPFLADSCLTYSDRRRRLSQTIVQEVGGVADIKIMPSVDGPNIWLQLPARVSATAVAERAAAANVLVAAGEPFFINVGWDNALRINAGMIAKTEVENIGKCIAEAILSLEGTTSDLMFHHSL